MNTTSFVQLDETLAFNPGYITRVRFGVERVTVYFIGDEFITLINEQYTTFIEWWNQRAIVVSKVNDDAQDDDTLYFVRGQLVPGAPEM